MGVVLFLPSENHWIHYAI